MVGWLRSHAPEVPTNGSYALLRKTPSEVKYDAAADRFLLAKAASNPTSTFCNSWATTDGVCAHVSLATRSKNGLWLTSVIGCSAGARRQGEYKNEKA